MQDGMAAKGGHANWQKLEQDAMSFGKDAMAAYQQQVWLGKPLLAACCSAPTQHTWQVS